QSYSITETVPATWKTPLIACSLTGPNGSSSSVNSPTVTLDVKEGEDYSCTYTNTKEAGLTVTKTVIPASDAGKFDLKIDGVTKAAAVGDGGTTGNVVVTTGVAHTVSEALATGTSLSNYDVVIGGNCAADGTVTLQAGD